MVTRTLVALLALSLTACGGDGEGSDSGPDDVVLEETHPPLTGAEVGSGDYTVRWDLAEDELTLSRGDDVLLRFEKDGFRLGRVDEVVDSLSYDPWFLYPAAGMEDLYTPPAGLAWMDVQGAVLGDRTDDVFTVELDYGDGLQAELEVRAVADGRFELTWTPGGGGPDLAFFRMRPRVDPEEGFYGLGNVHDHPNHRGHTRPMQIEVQLDVESATNEAHSRVPLLIGTRGWGIFVESLRGGVFDVAVQADDLVETTWGTGPDTRKGLKVHLFGSDHPLDVTRHYYEVTGYPTPPARWALGPLIWRDEGVNQIKVIDDLEKIREHDLACSGYWIDRPYASAVNSFDFKPSDYPDPKGMIDAAHDMGFRMALWHSPYVDPKDDDSKALYEHAKEQEFFPPLTGLTFDKWGPLLDFTNPDAFAWWQGLLEAYTDMGIEGYKLDYAEEVQLGAFGVRTAWTFHDGSDERTMHHRYQWWYHKVYAETLPDDGGFLLTRTALYGDQVHPVIVWPGDLDASFHRQGDEILDDGFPKKAVGGLPASMVYGLSLGPSGFPFYGADTGGYIDVNGDPDKELFSRWMEQTALSSVMQVGNGESTVPWELGGDDGYDEEMLGWYREYSRLHLRLFPYEWTCVEAIEETGRPIQRPFGLAYPETGKHPWDEYLFGDDLLVAPVMERDAREREVIFPPGRWVDWWDGTVYEGSGTVLVDAPLSKLPLYLREGGIIPMLRPTIDTLAPVSSPDEIDSFATSPGMLFARVAAGEASTFELYDGAVLGQAKADDRLTLTSTDGEEFEYGTVFEVMGLGSAPSSVTDNGAVLDEVDGPDVLEDGAPGWAWEQGRGGVLWVGTSSGNHEIVVQ